MTINWVMQLTEPMFEVLGHPFSGRDLILLGGGLFLIAKSTQEMYEKIEGELEEDIEGWFSGLPGIIVQIMILDIIFSLTPRRAPPRRGHRDRGDASVCEADR